MPKLKFFLWRMLLRILPVREDLQRHGLDVPTLCPICDSGEGESLEHLFIRCPVAIRLRDAIGLSLPLNFDSSYHFALLWRLLLCHDAPYIISDWLILCWRLWKGRNNVVFSPYAQFTVPVFRRQFLSHRDSNRLAIVSPAPPPLLPSRNRASSAVLSGAFQGLRLAVDGATSSHQSGAIGIVGLTGVIPTFAFGSFIRGVSNPGLVELLAIQEALYLLQRWHWHDRDLLLTGDAQVVIDKLVSGNLSDARAGAIYSEVHALLVQLPKVVLQFMPRNANRAAHLVAQHALRFPGLPPLLFDFCYLFYYVR
ncbi:unnamed protein product [Linum trigynum]|uniref:Reverse transcriptase zinc-binding domain-containing protein n=1 Tax=Linum trigynum TaxID=586398 RepID=A0AAV2EKQ2_9ROSI